MRKLIPLAHGPYDDVYFEGVAMLNRDVPDETMNRTKPEAPPSIVSLLSRARGFVEKSRCSMGHSIGEIMERSKPGPRHCLYCEHQVFLYRQLDDAVQTHIRAEPT